MSPKSVVHDTAYRTVHAGREPEPAATAAAAMDSAFRQASHSLANDRIFSYFQDVIINVCLP